MVPIFFDAIGPGTDIFIPDHRGTGYSDFLVLTLRCDTVATNRFQYCPESSGLNGCVDYVNAKYKNTVQFFTTSNAAMDVIYGMKLTKSIFDYQFTYLYGISYGTYWSNRLLVIAPTVPDAVVLDGICPPTLCRFDTYDEDLNDVGMDFMSQCGTDPTCVNNLGLQPSNALTMLYYHIELGDLPCLQCIHCSYHIKYLHVSSKYEDILCGNCNGRIGP